MNLVENIIRDLLKESVEQPKVEDAIRKHYEVMINYTADDEAAGKGQRIIQPTTLGISKSGNMVVRAFQPNGDTKTKIPSWKLFRLDRIDKWQSINRIFTEPKGFNKTGDNSMQTVLLNASFNGLSRDQIMKNIDFSNKKRKFKSKNKYNNVSGNQSSVNDMSKSKDFGDNNFSQTIGPVKKGMINNKTQDLVNNNKVNYTNALKNGPRFKENNGNVEDLESNEEYGSK